MVSFCKKFFLLIFLCFVVVPACGMQTGSENTDPDVESYVLHQLVQPSLVSGAETLDLSDYRLQSIEGLKDEDEKYLSSVKKLALKGNGFKEFPEGLSKLFSSVEVLYLPYNGLESLPDDFGSCMPLRRLILGGENKEFLRGSIQDGRLHISRENIPGNKLQELPELLCRGKAMLEYLDVRGNNIKRLYPELQKNPSNRFSLWWNMPNLQCVDFSDNDLKTLPADFFKRSPNLRVLLLSGNKLTKLSNLTRVRKLQHVDVSNNQLTEIPYMGKMTSLRELIVHHNKLNTAPKGVERLPFLDLIDVSDNQLSSEELAKIKPFDPKCVVKPESEMVSVVESNWLTRFGMIVTKHLGVK